MTAPRREFSKRVRLEIVQRSMDKDGRVICEGCGQVLGAKKYEIDHVIPEALIIDKTKELTASDGQLLGVSCCHRGGNNKTAKDVGDIARAVRRQERHLGIKKPRSFRRPPGARFDWSRGRYIREEETV